MKSKAFGRLASAGLLTVSLAVGLGAIEGTLRLKNRSQKNYDIEMWRYARELKFASGDPELGHEHVPNQHVKLQGVSIRTNSLGLRGAEPLPKQAGRRDILFLGSSITLGWGVPEEETVSAQVQQLLSARGETVQTLNAGIGNYNSARYVKRFFSKLQDLQPTDIVVHYFLRDAEKLDAGRGNWFLKNSQLAVTAWNVFQRLGAGHGSNTLLDHYKAVYEPAAEGRQAMEQALEQLARYAQAKGISLVLAMTPDVHNLKDYPFHFIHQEMSTVAQRLGYRYLDLYPALAGYEPSEIWSMPGDPHPNGFAHKRMAAALAPFLLTPPTSSGRNLASEK